MNWIQLGVMGAIAGLAGIAGYQGGLFSGADTGGGGVVSPLSDALALRMARISSACTKAPKQVSCWHAYGEAPNLKYFPGDCDLACAGPETATVDGKTLPISKKGCVDPARVAYDAFVEKCPGGAVDGEGWCGCLTSKPTSEPVAEEVASKDDLPAKDLHAMVVCPQTESGGGVTYPLASAELPHGCVQVMGKVLMPGVTTNSIPTGIEADLETACFPCKVQPGAWGPCPHCLLWPGGCAKACDVATGTP